MIETDNIHTTIQPLAIIQSLWIGDKLSPMEQLCISSFLAHGHPFHLYTYDTVLGIPDGVMVKDANEIVPANMIFTYKDNGSYAGFSNIFRYKLLLDKGGYWVDTDTICLQPFTDESEYIFSSERSKELSDGDEKIHKITNVGVIKVPIGSDVMHYCYTEAISKDTQTLRWGEIGPRLMDTAIKTFGLESYVAEPEVFCPINYWSWNQLIDPSIDKSVLAGAKTVHLWNEMWRHNNIDKSANFDENSIYTWLQRMYFHYELVSVVIPCYNQGQYLEEAVQSVIDQTYPNIEIIIVNDGSLDNTAEIASLLQLKYPGIQILTQENKGLYAARNYGIQSAVGKYIIPLDADDKLDKTMVEKCTTLAEQSHADIVYSGYQAFGDSTQFHLWKPFTQSNPLYRTPCSATSLYKRNAWKTIGGYKQNMIDGYEDWEFWVNNYKHNFIFQDIPEKLFLYRVKETSMFTEAMKKDPYLKAKIKMNHPELYPLYQVKEAIRTIKETENLPDFYFYSTDTTALENQQILSSLSDYLENHDLDEKALLDIEDYKIGICTLDLFEGSESINCLSEEMNTDVILFYAPLRYTVSSLLCQNKAWKSAEGFIPVNGSVFEYVVRSKRENIDTQLLAYQRTEKYLREKCQNLEKSIPKPIKYHLQLFLDLGNGYNEANSLKLPVAQHNQLQTFSFDLSNYQKIANLRLDPLNESCVMKLEAFAIITSDGTELDLKPHIYTNACNHQDKNYFFESRDPNILFHELNAEKLSGAVYFHATLQYIHIARDAVHECINQIQTATDTHIKSQEHQIKKLKEELLSVHTSKSWKYTKILRKLKKLTRIRQ